MARVAASSRLVASKEVAARLCKKLRANCLTFAAALRHITRDCSQLAPVIARHIAQQQEEQEEEDDEHGNGLQTTCGDIIV